MSIRWTERELGRLRMVLEREQSQSIYEMAQTAHKTLKRRSVNSIQHKLREMISDKNFVGDMVDLLGETYPAKIISGYVVITLPDGTQTPAHIFVWESLNGPIPSGYHVHHRNDVRTDNRPVNLMLLTASDHIAWHMSGKPPESFIFFSFLQETGLWNNYLDYRERIIKDIFK
jgi:hypothetical protein